MEEETKPKMSSDQFSMNLDHAKSSYANAQEAIRFVDSKTAILTGIVVVSTGLPFAIAQLLWTSEATANPILAWLDHYREMHPLLLGIKCALSIIGSVCGVFSLLASTNGLMARLPREGSKHDPNIFIAPIIFLINKIPFIQKLSGCCPKLKDFLGGGMPPSQTCLFPLHNPDTVVQARVVFTKMGQGQYSELDILREYEIQLECVGAILNIKIRRNREAVGWFEVQILAYAVCAFSFLFCWVCL